MGRKRRTDDQLLEVIRNTLLNEIDYLWDKLTPEERRRVFKETPEGKSLLEEYIDVTY